MAFTNEWNEAVPTNENFGFELDDFDRRAATNIRERGGVQHKTYADETSKTDVWEHKPGECNVVYVGTKASFPTPTSSNGGCYAIATDENKQEYYWSGTAWVKCQEPVLITGDQTIAGHKTFGGAVTINGAATLAAISSIKAGSVMSTSAAPTTDPMIANKKYVDDQIDATVGAGVFDPLAYAGEGSMTFPNGLIMKWGYYSTPITGESSRTVTFPSPFPTACLHAQATAHNAGGNGTWDMWMQIESFSKTQLVCYAQYSGVSSNLSGFYWFAIGH
jgi:hypothetical protein